MFDLGVNKTTVAARRIAELDPYLTVRTIPTGVTSDDVDAFLDGLDVVVEECDSLDVKALVRREAKTRRLPVLMATSDRGLVDVERFDTEPDRPIFHGLLGEIDLDALSGLSNQAKIPYVLRLIEVGGLSARAAASLLEVGQTLTTWPQLAGDVTLGAGAVTSRAPSGGNTQPWTIEATHDCLTIQLRNDRTTLIDIGLRGSSADVGAAVYNARVAAVAHGVVGQVR